MKRILLTQSKSPHGSINGQEGLDAILMGSAFTQCAVLFHGDGVYQLLKHQQPKKLGTKDYAATFGALADYGVEQICCIEEDLIERKITTQELVIPVSVVDRESVRDLIRSFDLVLDF
jgi:tRNA 2-thiouridine synthesizing protein C